LWSLPPLNVSMQVMVARSKKLAKKNAEPPSQEPISRMLNGLPRSVEKTRAAKG